jgi:hypothetical protein
MICASDHFPWFSSLVRRADMSWLLVDTETGLLGRSAGAGGQHHADLNDRHRSGRQVTESSTARRGHLPVSHHSHSSLGGPAGTGLPSLPCSPGARTTDRRTDWTPTCLCWAWPALPETWWKPAPPASSAGTHRLSLGPTLASCSSL